MVSPLTAAFEFFGFGRKPRIRADVAIKLIKEQIAYDRRALDRELAPMQRFWIKNHLAKAELRLAELQHTASTELAEAEARRRGSLVRGWLWGSQDDPYSPAADAQAPEPKPQRLPVAPPLPSHW
ncbi:hypothetical protein ACWIEX_19860 [Bosea sp. NPDC055353]